MVPCYMVHGVVYGVIGWYGGALRNKINIFINNLLPK